MSHNIAKHMTQASYCCQTAHITSYKLNRERLIDLPEQTFFNLPEEKKQRIIDAAIDEFAAYSVRDASIARIITAAGIPRGSFYQYFTDIIDLYKYIMSIVGEMKMEILFEFMRCMDEMPVFETIRMLYDTGIKFASEHP
ncbi:MAG: TetR/AcrR family transcriptional regulator, partial [Bacillota bacterium]|nr:TetR/AcrR family transcriptional regulator [Bacillota bacterium]